MAFGQLKEWFPNITHVDPRISEQYSTGSKYCVVSITREPTYQQLAANGKTVANSRMLGLITSFSAPQVRPIVRVYEIGSRYPYSVPGKFTGRIDLSSIFFDAAGNILGNIYDTVFGVDGNPDNGTNPPTAGDIAIGNRLINRPRLYVEGQRANYSMADVGATGSYEPERPGVGSIRMSLDDNALDTPFGMVLSIFQSEKRVKSIASIEGVAGGNAGPIQTQGTNYRIISCLFFEMVKATDYNFGLSAENEIIGESASFFYTGLVNVKTALPSGEEIGTGRTALEPGPF